MDAAKGTNAQTGLERKYPGMDQNHIINSKGSFVHRKVRKLENAASMLKPSTSRKAHKAQHQGQESLTERRVKILKTHGDFRQTMPHVEGAAITNQRGRLTVEPCGDLEAKIAGIKQLAAPPENSEAYVKTSVTEAGMKHRAQKDLTLFFAHCLKSAESPTRSCSYSII